MFWVKGEDEKKRFLHKRERKSIQKLHQTAQSKALDRALPY